MTSCIEAALELAAGGTPAFPVLANKQPATPHGFKDATTDSVALQNLWHPGCLVGVPTGDVSGFDALDLDAKHDDAKQWWRNNRHHLPTTRVHRTRSGGLHLLFKHDSLVRSTAGKDCARCRYPRHWRLFGVVASNTNYSRHLLMQFVADLPLNGPPFRQTCRFLKARLG